ncbi:MAG: type II toxin-antitoxin system RelE/ParE family toxin [SAR202 cluster bacterium]|nr:type II toxin-antitoxin system RelE/ParE family toxin [SAR202 cluster bacterium]
MGVLRKRAQAYEDLLEIWACIARDSLEAADGLIDSLEALCRLLADNPGMGRPRPDLTPDLRSATKGRYAIFYMPIQNGVEVIRVLNLSRWIDAGTFEGSI